MILKTKMRFLLLNIIYIFLYHTFFIKFLLPIYLSSYIVTLQKTNATYFVISIIICVFISTLIPLEKFYKRPSLIVIIELYYLLYIPSVIMAPYCVPLNVANKSFVLNTFSFLFLITSYFIPHKKIKTLSFNKSKGLYWLTISFFLIFVALYFNIYKIPRFFIKYTDIYNIRALYSATELSGFESYYFFIIWIISLFFICLSLSQKKYLFLIVPTLTSYWLFTLSGIKNILFSIISIVVIYLVYIVPKIKNSVIFIFPFGLSFLLVISALLSSITTIPLFLLARVLYTPGILGNYYFDFFSSKIYMFFSSSFLRFFISNPYGQSASFLISKEYTFNPEANAVANFIADAFSNAGIGGILGVLILLIFILNIIDSLSDKESYLFTLLILAPRGYLLANTSLFTNFLTYGFLLIPIFIIIKKSYIKNKAI